MTKLKEFYTSFGFIVSFMFLSVLISALLGEKFLNKFLLLVLTSQLLLNADKATTLINKFTLSNKKVTSGNDNKSLDNKYSGDVKGGLMVDYQAKLNSNIKTA